MTTPDVASLPAKCVDNPWREFIENVISGDNYFRASEYYKLLDDLDRLYALEQQPAALTPAGEGGLPELPPSLGFVSTHDGEYGSRSLEAGDDYYTADQMRAYANEARRLATTEQPGSSVQGEANADRWVAIKPEGAPYWGIHTETGETIAGTSSGLSEGAAKRIVALHNNELCEADDLLRELGLDPIRFRSEGGWLNAGKIRAALLHPQDYADLYTTPPPAPAAEQGDETGPYPFGAGLQQSPAARYWQQRSEFWMGKAISLGWREVRDAANGEVPATQPEARGVEGMVLDRFVAFLKPRADYDSEDYSAGILTDCWHVSTADLDRALRHVLTPNPVRAEQPEGKWKLVPVNPSQEWMDAFANRLGIDSAEADNIIACLPSAPAAPGVAVGVDGWQILVPGTDRGWEPITKREYDASLRTGRAWGIECATKDFEVRELFAAPAAPAVGVDGRRAMTPYMAKLWLDEQLADRDETLSSEVYDAIIAALAGKAGA